MTKNSFVAEVTFHLFRKPWLSLLGGVFPGGEEGANFQLKGFSPHPPVNETLDCCGGSQIAVKSFKFSFFKFLS